MAERLKHEVVEKRCRSLLIESLSRAEEILHQKRKANEQMLKPIVVEMVTRAQRLGHRKVHERHMKAQRPLTQIICSDLLSEVVFRAVQSSRVIGKTNVYKPFQGFF
jgi:hypothetical protein